MEEHAHETLEEALVDYPNLNCDDLTVSDFERIGDAVMEENHPGEAHERMDAMMGGEGSERLSQMHINMGKSYLNCYTKDEREVSNMGYMMNTGYGSWSGAPMMNSSFGLLWGVNSLLVTVLLVVLIRYFWTKGGGKK